MPLFKLSCYSFYNRVTDFFVIRTSQNRRSQNKFNIQNYKIHNLYLKHILLKFFIFPISLCVFSCGGSGDQFSGGNGSRKVDKVEGVYSGEDSVKLPEKAIQKGSFTAYAVPPNPAIKQNYKIIIIVDLKNANNTSNYTKADLSGTLAGTDGYMYHLGSERAHGKFPASVYGQSRYETFQSDVTTNEARYEIFVPASNIQSTKDVITIGSSLLKETQTLEIVFGENGGYPKTEIGGGDVYYF